ncbi:hypothetical protein ACFPME_17495 [Rhodanobacter umsongensis]|uniref:Uncharacterized protein n=1 Tax=Rhodanobacter umsongensis TaxID=633153 RepID=A0ABW0JQJ3_9GAMM
MSITKNDQRKWCLNFFKSKVKEFDFYLRGVVECCDQSMLRFKTSRQGTEHTENKIVFAFSAFANTIQTLKDSGSIFLPTKITWGDIAGLRHGKFMELSRNAATHDGHPIVTAWADGHYFVPADIHRFDSRGDLIKIVAPTEDVSQFCLEFSRDFGDFLATRVRALEPMESVGFGIDELEHGLQSRFVPEFVRQLFRDRRSEIEKAMAEVKTDPAEGCRSILMQVIEFCDERLAASQMN